MRYSLTIVLAISFIFLATHLMEQVGIDFYVQRLLYSKGLWLIDGANPTLRFYFYEGPKQLLAGVSVLALAVTLIHRRKYGKADWHIRVFFFLTCMAMVPLLISLLKEITFIYCPSQIIEFGGTHTLRPLFDFTQAPEFCHRGKCYPAGHATAGFALMSLYYVFEKRFQRILGLLVGVVVGSILAFYQMAKGAHFLSHSLATFALSWVIIITIHRFFIRYKKV